MSLLSDLLNLNLSDTTEKVIAEYIWAIHGVALLVGFLLWRDTDMIGGSGMDLRSKARTLNGPVRDPSDLPNWNYDGSNPNLAPGEDGDVILRPVAIFKDPFRKGNNILVMCDTYTPAGEPIPTNKRHTAAKIFSHPGVVAEEPWYGIEQEYTLLLRDAKGPIGLPVGGYASPQGPYYCGIGADKAFRRDVVDSHYKACLYAGINIGNVQGGVMPGQWEFQVGPARGISAGDELWVARYILERITEIAGVVLSFDPKPIQGDRNGAGACTNYSTKSMRNNGGRDAIRKARERIELRGKEQIWAYYFTGRNETADINSFLWLGESSIGVGRNTEEAGNGYLEYRGSASDMDPYVVTSLIAETTILWKPFYHSALEQVWHGIIG